MLPEQRVADDDPRVELQRRSLDAWNRRDVDASLACYHEDAVFVLIGGFETMLGREFHGRGELRGFFEEFQATFDEVHIEIEDAIPAGERILFVVNSRNRGEAGGVETNLRWGQVQSFRDGLIDRSENYYELEDALVAIGAR